MQSRAKARNISPVIKRYIGERKQILRNEKLKSIRNDERARIGIMNKNNSSESASNRDRKVQIQHSLKQNKWNKTSPLVQ